jgi:hypothetical protein
MLNIFKTIITPNMQWKINKVCEMVMKRKTPNEIKTLR